MGSALRFISENSELQSRYLLEGHPRQWRNELWGKLPSPHSVDEDLVESVQQTLAHAYLVGHSAELDSFVYAIYRLLGLRHRKATRLLGHHDDDSNVTPQYNRSALSTAIRTAAHGHAERSKDVRKLVHRGRTATALHGDVQARPWSSRVETCRWRGRHRVPRRPEKGRPL